MAAIRPVFVIALALMLSGCAMYRLEDLRQTKPTGNAFQTALARMYMDMATQMEKGYDWFASWHFAEKGLLLAYGKDVAPEAPGDWNIPAADLSALQQARGQLLVALTPQNEAAQPEIAARAQLDFDCWVRYQDANWQTDRISECREGFKTALSQLQMPPPPPVVEEVAPEKPKAHMKAKKKDKKKEKKEKKKKTAETKPIATEEMAPETVSYVVFFDPGKAEIATASHGVIKDITHSLAHQGGYEVIIHGYGSEAGKNVDPLLASERIQAIKKQLTTGGVKGDAISVSGFGISKARLKNGAPEVIRRRVDIFVNE